MSKSIIKHVYEKDIYHLSIVSIVFYLCTYTYELFSAKYLGIPAGVISIGVTDIVRDMFFVFIYLSPIIILYMVSNVFISNVIIARAFVSTVSILLCIIICFYRDISVLDPTMSLFLLIASSLFFKWRCEGKELSDLFKIKKEVKIPDVFVCFSLLLSLCTVSGFIGNIQTVSANKKIVHYDNSDYFIIKTYGDNVFLKSTLSTNSKVLWIKLDSSKVISLN